MGFLSGKKTITVASTVYNLAGEEKDRPIYMDSLVMRNILTQTKDTISDTLKNGYLNGPSIRFRQFFKWVRRPENYDQVGMPTGSISQGLEVIPADLEGLIPVTGTDEAWIQYASIGNADYSYWAEQWIMENRPEDLYTLWISDFDGTTITIRFEDEDQITFEPEGYDKAAHYLYAYYITVSGSHTNDAAFSADSIYIYKIGSGNVALDALYVEGSDYGEFFPCIPVRIDGDTLGKDEHPDVYEQCKKAYKKATGGKFDELIEKVMDNEKIDDVDHAYVVFGVSLNVVEDACKKYLYGFFDKLRLSQIGGADAYNEWLGKIEEHITEYDTWRAWKARQSLGGHDEDTDPEPPRPHMPQMTKNQIRINSDGKFNTHFDFRLQWSFIEGGSGTGLFKEDAQPGDIWIENTGSDEKVMKYYSSSTLSSPELMVNSGKIRITWQRTKDEHTFLDIIGMVHQNYIYGGKSVDITAHQALADPSESGFIVPMHYETWREARITDTSQMATACVFIVFNSYEVVKQKWYETFIFRIILIIVIAIASAVFFPGGIGLLGAHLAVGTAMGFSGLTAAIVGSIVNSMAALVVSTILEKVANAFGILGPIIATVLGIMMGGLVSSFNATGVATFNWGSMLRVDNILKLTNSVGGSIQKFMQADIVAMQEENQRFQQKATAELSKIKELYIQDFGYGKVSLDPLEIASSSNQIVAESSSTFLSRTLLTGSDIATMTNDMLTNFSEYSLKLPDAFV